MIRFLLLTIFLFCTTVFAQTQEKQKARMIDEFGRLGECDLGIRLENLRTELNSDKSVKGLIIVYQSIDAYPAEYDSNSFLNYIKQRMNFLRLDESRVNLINGGFRKQVSAEIWIVPQDVENPKPSETLPRPIIPTDKTFVFANKRLVSFDFDDPIEFLSASVKKERLILQKEIEGEEQKNGVEPVSFNEFSAYTKEEIEEMKFNWAIESFGNLLKERELSTGTIIFYGDNKYYNIKNIHRHVEKGKNLIAKNTGISSSRIKVIYGGYRTELEAEFWIVPQNGRLPKPKPEKREN